MICVDEMGPDAAKSYPGHRVVAQGRAQQEIDYGRRDKGYTFGAFRPSTGEAFTHPYDRRTGANWIDFLERVDEWVPPGTERIYAILDNLSTHRTTDVLLFQLTHPRWEVTTQRGDGRRRDESLTTAA